MDPRPQSEMDHRTACVRGDAAGAPPGTDEALLDHHLEEMLGAFSDLARLTLELDE
jgi:hypothetical protein